MSSTSFLSDLLQTIADRGRALLGRGEGNGEANGDPAPLLEALLSGRGEASGVALAHAVLARFERLDPAGRRAFLKLLADGFGPDRARLERALAPFRALDADAAIDAAALAELHAAAEPRRQELIRRLNLAPGGVAALVRMREHLLAEIGDDPALKSLDTDFVHLFASWFNRGFLVLRRIDWTTSANVLEKIIEYEAVHEIGSWDELRRRLAPPDRRLYAFFHPQLADDPLIFVEVALTDDIPATIDELLGADREPIAADTATTAVFYSISNCQAGLKGISFGNFLIKQVVEELRRELPKLDTFVTLSPVPGFAAWLARERRAEVPSLLDADTLAALAFLDEPGWQTDPNHAATARQLLPPVAAAYLVRAKSPSGRPVDPVARFHLGNGARLERIDPLADLSPRGLAEAHGVMVNYLYRLADIEKNHEAFASRGDVVAGSAVTRLLGREKPKRGLVPVKTKDAPKEAAR